MKSALGRARRGDFADDRMRTRTSASAVTRGGGRAEDGRYARLEGHGLYWTASERSSAPARGMGVEYLRPCGRRPGRRQSWGGRRAFGRIHRSRFRQ